MHPFGIALALAFVATALAGFAVVYQWRDLVASRGGSMGAEMTAGLVWLLAALLAGAGVFTVVRFAFAVAAVAAVLALSFLVRTLLPRFFWRLEGRRAAARRPPD